MWWNKRKRPEPDTDVSDTTLHAQLVAASENLRRQIEVQGAVRFSRGGGYGGDDLAVRTLQAQLDRVEEALANLGEGDS